MFFLCMLIILGIPSVIYVMKYSISRIKTENCSKLDINATIVGIRSEPDNRGREKHIKTIVQFSDGSEYHTYYTKSEPGFGYTRITVDSEVIEQIKEKAIVAHKEKTEKAVKDLS